MAKCHLPPVEIVAFVSVRRDYLVTSIHHSHELVIVNSLQPQNGFIGDWICLVCDYTLVAVNCSQDFDLSLSCWRISRDWKSCLSMLWWWSPIYLISPLFRGDHSVVQMKSSSIQCSSPAAYYNHPVSSNLMKLNFAAISLVIIFIDSQINISIG